ncbi:MAG: transcription termination factor NusA [Dehalococcoidales bacterium]|nr:transcription termination factor NusA [Dehalococcoidales bacterium]
MKSDFISAINQLCSEKGVPKEVVLQAVEAALISAYKRNFASPGTQQVTVKVDPQTGQARVFVEKQVLAEVKDRRTEMTLAEARAINPNAQMGDSLEVETTPSDFGRIAAQTAKQVVLQRLREAERDMVFEEFREREGDIVTGVVQRVEPKALVIDLGKAEGTLPSTEQVPAERYHLGQRLKLYIVEVERSHRGPQIILSRTHRNLLKRLFELEVPEIYNGIVEIKSIAREPGSRSKVAVHARQEGVDPVGACVGMRGVRIQNIVGELGGEKIDVVQWHAEPTAFIANALSPAQVIHVDVSEPDKTATVIVPERQLSLAIGKEGQNARLAAKLTGWRIDIKPTAGLAAAKPAERSGNTESGQGTGGSEAPSQGEEGEE